MKATYLVMGEPEMTRLTSKSVFARSWSTEMVTGEEIEHITIKK
jgi:hypothetical protein